MSKILYVLAAICFLCGALSVKLGNLAINWTDLGFFFVTVATFLL